ncbi:hypothetical protein Aple_094380 [Acrocarpospora pleiomorpha]|uniref:Lipoprotein n=1 Tax=Acrocarpospora pleiomorpha TaxID=90975 RepID=A0A5M3Y2T8_9ACTN|nr:hypothetical protein [Acrocarpospora pleiomorpha]GES26539.1 hypothetical protein Aple_094380 [Acrocarpospora pleiomorpha]
MTIAIRTVVLGLAAALATACGAPAAPAPSQGIAQVNPLDALTAQLVEGRGVSVRELQETHVDGEKFNDGERTGKVQFNPAGVEGYDVTMKTSLMESGTRSVAVGPHTYQSGDPVEEVLPKGKKWQRWPSEPGKRSPFFTPMLILEPSTLKAVLATETEQIADVRKGQITLGALSAASPSLSADEIWRPDDREAALVMTWQMWTNPEGLPVRLLTEYRDPAAPLGDTLRKSDIRFTSWGGAVDLRKPPARLVSKGS